MFSNQCVSQPPGDLDAGVNRANARRFWQGFAEGTARHAIAASTLVDGYAGERLRLGTFRHMPHVLTDEALPREHRQAVLLTLQLNGRAQVEQHDRRSEIEPGDFCLIDLSRPFRLEIDRSTVQTVHLPLAVLREAVPRLDEVSAVGLHGHLGSVGYLRVLYQEMFAHPSGLTEAVADRLADAIPHMLAAALESMDVAAAAPSRLRQYHKRQVRLFAREHLSDPALCVEMIAKGVGLSPSHLFELFSEDDITLMRWVRLERLARCQRELADPSLRHRSIAQIAHAWGFGDMTHFSRCFRDRFGMSPRAYRQTAISGARPIVSRMDVHTSNE
ncbi:helix-turn-helix domain-containing protein [Luteibacter sp. E-22]|uniref:helix-turn-helix domain-containing protein n=1 Tax=Luteibacter sp. E-22 TaxID=3404050 RepID=UPI003CE8CD0E